jgi:hypothetical protein
MREAAILSSSKASARSTLTDGTDQFWFAII